MDKIRKKREIIQNLINKKELSTGQKKLDLTTELANEYEKLRNMLNPKKVEL